MDEELSYQSLIGQFFDIIKNKIRKEFSKKLNGEKLKNDKVFRTSIKLEEKEFRNKKGRNKLQDKTIDTIMRLEETLKGIYPNLEIENLS